MFELAPSSERPQPPELLVTIDDIQKEALFTAAAQEFPSVSLELFKEDEIGDGLKLYAQMMATTKLDTLNLPKFAQNLPVWASNLNARNKMVVATHGTRADMQEFRKRVAELEQAMSNTSQLSAT